MGVVEGKAPNGKGGVNQQFVDAEGRAGTRALAETDQQHAVGEGNGFTFHSVDAAQSAEESWYLKNDGEDIVMDSIEISTSVSGVFSIMRQTSGTAAGTEMFGRNMIAGNSDMADVTAFGSAAVTGSVDGDLIVAHDLGTSAPYVFAMHGYTLPSGQAIFVRTELTGQVNITGYVHRD